jgi:hypothetical protein
VIPKNGRALPKKPQPGRTAGAAVELHRPALDEYDKPEQHGTQGEADGDDVDRIEC